MKEALLLGLTAFISFGCPSGTHSPASGGAIAGLEFSHAPRGCEVYAYKSAAAIPDGDPSGVLLGPLEIPSGQGVIGKVTLGLSVAHPYSGDLRIWLHYDCDNDGKFEASTPIEVFLARLDTSEAEELWAYPIELSGTYFFRDEGWSAVDEHTSLRSFEGLPRGGSFYLRAVDDCVENTGAILGWAIQIETLPGDAAHT